MHGAYIGTTQSGKTYAAQRRAAQFRRAGVKVLALRKEGEEWPADSFDWSTEDPEEFLAMVEVCTACACFMELGDADVDHSDVRFHRLFRKGRHFKRNARGRLVMGHRFFYLAQRGELVHPNVRGNCTELTLFSCGFDAAKKWATEFCDKALLEAATLPQWAFLYKASRFAPVQRFARLA